jgi:hypothetical protein
MRRRKRFQKRKSSDKKFDDLILTFEFNKLPSRS